uniref:Reverse transcriptase domain-containing protein n=1 Tax=Tanacetum cinerariifolium TaxID=118510 RepID=A0A699HPV6_TANCI|nr:reverse transcriptase domain-containing protein [Tanacetum cinerariifolium]
MLRRNLDIFAWKPADMIGVPRHIAEHSLNIREGCPPVRQKKRGQTSERNKAIYEEVEKLVDAGIMKEVNYHNWLSNPVMVKKHDYSWRMCVDFKDLNKACLKDGYLLSKIDWKVEFLYVYPFKCFLDAYKGYHQIKMANEDEEKTAFITSQGIFCYLKMPFELKIARATYQHLVDKAFQKQIGQNLEVYMDDLVIKSHTEQEIIRDMEETFKTLREINMKLNPKKCTFGIKEGMFLGYKVNADGLREDDLPDTPIKDKEELSDPWIMFTDGSSCIDGSRAGQIITNPEGMELTYALRFSKGARHDQILGEGQKPRQHFQRILHQTSTWRKEQKSRCTEQDGIHQLAHLSKRGPGKVRFLIVAIDYFTKWIEAKPMETITGAQIKKFVWNNIVSRFGLPREIISDNKKQFRDNPFKDWSLGKGIKARLDERSKNWMEEISPVLWAHRTMIKSSNGETSFSLTYGTKAVIPLEISMPTLRNAKVDMIKNNEALEINLDLLEEKREHAAIQEAKSKAMMEKYYNVRVRNTSFKPGDLVYWSNEASHAEEGGKLEPKWEGPYKVTEALRKEAYKLRDSNGSIFPWTWNV